MISMTPAGKPGDDGAGAHSRRPDLQLNARDRLCVTRRQREGLLAEYDQSGLSARRFAAAAGINDQTFAGWLKARRSRAGVKPARAAPAAEGRRPEAVTWIEAAPPAALREPQTERASKPLKVHLPGGAWMEVAGPEQVRAAALLLRGLSTGEGQPC